VTPLKPLSTFVVLVIASATLALTGCVLQGKPKTSAAAATPPPKPVDTTPKTPPPPPPPLSSVQTQIELPAPQPLSQEALNTIESAGTPPPPAPKPTNKKSAATPAVVAPKPEVVAPPQPAPNTTTPTEQQRPPIQEILSAADAARFKQGLDNFRAQIRDVLSKLPPVNRQSQRQKKDVADINTILRLADSREHDGDLRQAYSLAERAFVLAQGLQSAR